MIADWSVSFELTSALYSATKLPFNTVHTLPSAGTGIYLLRPDGCSQKNQVRATRNDVPQADGEILHRRFVSGMEMTLAIQLWQDMNNIACDDLQQEMLDELNGYLYQLINAGDNVGRIEWDPAYSDKRMLDDIRLLTYPEVSISQSLAAEVLVTIDTQWPYEMDLAEERTNFASSVTLTNDGNRSTYPVFQINGPFETFVLTNLTTDYSFSYDEDQLGAPNITAGHYVEINTFRNTIFKDGNTSNCKPGVVMETSDFFELASGANDITLAVTGSGSSASGLAITNAAWV